MPLLMLLIMEWCLPIILMVIWLVIVIIWVIMICTSRVLDQLAIDLPNLQNVFAAGNDGGLTCLNYPSAFRTVLSGYQSAKNVLTIGATDRAGAVTSFSSRGPVRDGRTKPELMADGFYTISTVPTPDDGYGLQQGTSMSAPAVTGGLALLYEKYRLQNSGANPKSGLMKALICNGGYRSWKYRTRLYLWIWMDELVAFG